MPPVIPDYVLSGLKDIRADMHLRWNPTAKLAKAGDIDATGKVRAPEYEPRWELWDKDPEGAEYMIMRLQWDETEAFREPGQWLLDRAKFMNPERWGGDLNKMMQELVEHPELLREAGTEKDSDDLIEAIARAASWHATPKSAAALTNRGKALLSA